MSRKWLPPLVLLSLLLAACGASADIVADDTTAATTTSTSTTVAETTTTEADDSGEVCPDIPLPDDAETTTPVTFDGNGDGEDDELSTYEVDGDWNIRVEWGAGGAGSIPLDDIGSMGVGAVGGYDIDGDGIDEAFIAEAGLASGFTIKLFTQDGCELKPVVFGNDEPVEFPVSSTAGTFSGASCSQGPTDFALMSGTVMDADKGEVESERVSYSFDPDSGTLVGEEESFDTLEGADLGELYGLNCGDLDDALGDMFASN